METRRSSDLRVSTDGYIDYDGAALDEEDTSGLGDAGVITGVTEVVTKEVEEVYHPVKCSSLHPIC